MLLLLTLKGAAGNIKKKLLFENCYKWSAINGLETRYISGTGTVMCQNRNRNFSEVRTETVKNSYGSTTLLRKYVYNS